MKTAFCLLVLGLGFPAFASPGTTIRVDGEGYLRFTRDGHVVYTTEATLSVVGGKIVCAEGLFLAPCLRATGSKISVDLEGNVQVDGVDAGRIVLAVLPDVQHLQRQGNFAVSSVHCRLINPGEGEAGVIRTLGKPNPGSTKPEPTKATALRPERAAAHLTTTPDAAEPTTIEVRGKTEVETGEVLLGDIADLSGSQAEHIKTISLGATALIGVKRSITATNILSRLLEAGLKRTDVQIHVPPGSFVIRKGQQVPAADIEKAGMDAIQTQVGLLVCADPAQPLTDLTIPVGDYTVEPGTAAIEAAKVTITISVRQGKTTVAERKLTLLPAPGTPQVKAFEVVTARVIRNGASIEMPAKTRSAGIQGQKIPVTIIDSGATLYGVLIAPGIVEVRL